MEDNRGTIKQISIKSNILFLSFVKIVTYFIPLITAPYLSRVLGPEGIGEYTYVYSIVSYFSLAVNFGFAGYGVREIAKYRKEKDTYSQTFWSIIFSRLVLLITSLALYMLLLLIIKNKTDIQVSIYLILSLTIFANFFDITYLYRGLENVKIISLANFGVRLLGLLAIFSFVKSREDIVFYTVIQASQFFLVAFVPWLFIKNSLKKPDWKKILLGTAFKEGFLYFLPSLAVTLCSLVDKTMLGSMSTKTEVGFYEQCDKIIIVVIGVLHSFAEVFTARVSLLIHENKEEEAAQKIKKMFELYSLVGMPASAGLFAIGSIFITTFFGADFSPAIVVFYLLVPLILIKSMSNALGNVYYGPRGLIWMTSIFYTIGAVINISTNAFLIPRYGASGAAVASMVSELIITIIFMVYARHKVDFKSIFYITLIPLFCSTLMALGIIAFNIVFSNAFSPIFLVVTDVIFGAILYCILLVVCRESLVIDELGKVINRFKE